MTGVIQCRACLVFVRCDAEFDEAEQVTYVTVRDDHPCNPALRRFYNPASQHVPPFTR